METHPMMFKEESFVWLFAWTLEICLTSLWTSFKVGSVSDISSVKGDLLTSIHRDIKLVEKEKQVGSLIACTKHIKVLKNHNLHQSTSWIDSHCDVCWIEALCFVESRVIALRYERSCSDLFQLNGTRPWCRRGCLFEKSFTSRIIEFCDGRSLLS